MKVEVHLLSHDDEPALEWAMRHYLTFSTKIVVHDGGPKLFESTKLVGLCPNSISVPWNTDGKLNDEEAMRLKNECWQGTDADFVICADADELIYFPKGAQETLETYLSLGAGIIKPHGFEMFSEVYPTGSGQIYDEVKMGARDDKWYSKPILFSPHKVAESGFGIGAHESNPVLKSGKRLYIGPHWPKANPPCFLLHFHQVGPIERIAERYDQTRRRLAKVNELHGWGNFKKGILHAQEKRDYILPRLEQVIA